LEIKVGGIGDMARLVQWHHPYTKGKAALRGDLQLISLLIYIIIFYSIGYVTGGLLDYFAIAAMIIVLIAGVFWRKPKISFGLIMLGAGMFIGMYLSAINNLILTALCICLAVLFIILFIVREKWISMAHEQMDVFVKGSYSIRLILKFETDIADMLAYNRYQYEKFGSAFQIELPDKERITISLGAMTVKDETKYEFIIGTNRKQETMHSVNIRRIVDKWILDMEQDGSFDSYPQIDRITCKKCGKNAHYNEAYGEIYCRACMKFIANTDVTIVEKASFPPS
jgi:hypothetical protein